MAKHVRLVYKQKPWALEVLAMAEASLIYKQLQHFHILARLFLCRYCLCFISLGWNGKRRRGYKSCTRHGALNEKHENQARWMLAVTGNMRRVDMTAT